MNLMKKVFLGKVDEDVHRQFIRFGKGKYGRRFLLSLRKTKKLKIKSSFEFANDFVLFAAGLGEVLFNGSIWSRDEIESLSGKKKTGKWVYEVKDLSSEKVKELSDNVYYFLLSGEGEGIKLKIKGKLPKPGKNEAKIDDKFCQLELDEKYYKSAKENFFWDLPDGKKMGVDHSLLIKEIVMPKTGEEDFAKIREMAKRKGTIIRNSIVDDKEGKTEKEFEV
ncbi:MAG TPA: hypothetical protein ENH99_03150 [Candidatus Pacearchaeota archaeon]|nr:hypothetical protein [Candidatus Pacearchaeota archaeon]